MLMPRYGSQLGGVQGTLDPEDLAIYDISTMNAKLRLSFLTLRSRWGWPAVAIGGQLDGEIGQSSAVCRCTTLHRGVEAGAQLLVQACVGPAL